VQIAEVVKWGQDIPVTDESIKRMRTAPLNTAVAKLINTIVKQVDGIALAAISSAVTHHPGRLSTVDRQYRHDPAGPAGRGRRPRPAAGLRARHRGRRRHHLRLRGLRPDRDRRAQPRGPGRAGFYTGALPVVGGLRILTSPHVPFITSALVLDSTQLGGMADEQLGGPGYTGGIGGVETKASRQDATDSYDLRARRVTVPVVVEPTAAIQITGVRA
jgi:hypothetical protein